MRIVATRFVNTLTQEPVVDRVSAGRARSRAEGPRRANPKRRWRRRRPRSCSSRAPKALLGYLLGHYLNIYIYYMLLNAKASEQSARMVSMKNATDSAEA